MTDIADPSHEPPLQAVDRRLLIAGAGGHAKVAIEVLRACGWDPVGLLAPPSSAPEVLGVPRLGDDDDAADFRERGIRHAFVAVGENPLRLRIGRRLQALGFDLPSLIHPSTVLSPTATIGRGVLVMPQAVVNAAAKVGDLAIINTAAIVEHDCVVGAGAHVAPRSVMGGHVTIGEATLFGIGATARPHARIGAHAVVGAGSVVVSDIPDRAVVAGVPARPLALR